MTLTDPVDAWRPSCAEVGFDLSALEPALLARLRLLAAHSQTVADAARLVSAARQVFGWYELNKPTERFSDGEQRIVVLGCLFSDIGKTGPAHATPAEQTLVVEMFAVEGVRDDRQTVTEFLRAYFPADAEERTRCFTELGLDPQMTIRQFWNLHSQWTFEIAEAGGVPREAVAAAATHHLLDDINPQAIVARDLHFTRPFGDNTSFDRAEQLVILLDKYDAARRRSGLGHDQAIAWLREKVRSNSRFRDNHELLTLLADLDAAGH